MEREAELAKVPAITLGFWLIKIVATTLGETAGDWVTMSLRLGYGVGSLIFASLFVVSAWGQVRAERLQPLRYWACIVATTTLGTTVADACDRSLGLGYRGGVAVIAALLVASLVAWQLTQGSIAAASVTTRRAQGFYWLTILLSQTLGTAMGDALADAELGGLGLGYAHSAICFGVGLLAVWLAHRWTRWSRTGLFWLAFVLTRPLGATFADYLDKPLSQGGLQLDRLLASLVLVGLILVCVKAWPQAPARD